MSGGGTVVLGASTTATGVAGVALLPNTGSYRSVFVIAAVVMTVGIVTLMVSGVAAVASRARA